MNACGADVHWPAVSIVGGIVAGLIVEGNFVGGREGVAVVSLDDLLQTGICVLPQESVLGPTFYFSQLQQFIQLLKTPWCYHTLDSLRLQGWDTS